MKRLNLFLLNLILLFSTALYAQNGKQNQDTIKCYGLTELRYIALSIVEGNTCDTLLSVCELKLQNRDSLISEKTLENNKLNEQLVIKDKIIIIKDEHIEKIDDDLKKEKLRHKFTKMGWSATTILLGAVITYLVIP